MSRRIQFAFLFFLIATSALAAESDWSGVWNGTLGNQKITVCINPSEYGAYYGSYYYAHVLEPIHLGRDSKVAEWKETVAGKETGSWRLDSVVGDTLNGQWRKPGGAASLPVHLTRVRNDLTAGKDKVPACGSDAFNAALEPPLKVKEGKVESFKGKRFRELSIEIRNQSFGIGTIELLEEGPHIAALNKGLRAEIDDGELYGCRRLTLSQFGDGGEYNVSMAIRLWTKRWFTVAVNVNAYCGGAYPSHHTEYRVWNLATGKRVDPSTWIKGQGRETPEALKKIQIAASSASIGCDNTPSIDEGLYLQTLEADGFVFPVILPHVVQNCEENIVIPYGKMLPFLTDEGKAEAKMLMEETGVK